MSSCQQKKHYHLIGIAGIGMSGIARMLVARGEQVSGSDLVHNRHTQELKALGVMIQNGHEAELIQEADVVVCSSAIATDNPELCVAREQAKVIMTRAEMLSLIMNEHHRIVIAGSHGKTTTSSLAATLLLKAGQDPSYVIGGVLHEQGLNAYWGQGQSIVVEADESDASFLQLQPDVAIVTNIDSDHLATYDNDIEKLEQAFLQFMNSVSEDGVVIACVDDERVAKLLPQVERMVITYSVTDQVADYRLTRLQIHQGTSQFSFKRSDSNEFEVTLAMPGLHNVSNALACIALADLQGLSIDCIQQALETFKGVGRRFDTYALEQMIIVDDYGHHPREVAVTLNAARANWPERKICLVFQPHRYTRTQQLFEEFVEVLQLADELILMDLYTAGEDYLEQADSDALAQAITASNSTQKVFRFAHVSDLIQHVRTHYGHDEVVILQGAGSIGAMVQPLLDGYRVAV